MGPAKFGPYFWGVLHIACLSNIDPEALQTLINLYPYILPCSICGNDFNNIIKTKPFPESNENKLNKFQWSVDVHNEVNIKLGKDIVNYEDALKFWTSEPIIPPMYNYQDIIILIFLMLLITLLIINKKYI